MKKLIKVLAVGMLLATTLIGCEKQEMYVEPACECRFEGVDELGAGRDSFFIDTDITDCSREGEIRTIGTVDTGFYLVLTCYSEGELPDLGD